MGKKEKNFDDAHMNSGLPHTPYEKGFKQGWSLSYLVALTPQLTFLFLRPLGNRSGWLGVFLVLSFLLSQVGMGIVVTEARAVLVTFSTNWAERLEMLGHKGLISPL